MGCSKDDHGALSWVGQSGEHGVALRDGRTLDTLRRDPIDWRTSPPCCCGTSRLRCHIVRRHCHALSRRDLPGLRSHSESKFLPVFYGTVFGRVLTLLTGATRLGTPASHTLAGLSCLYLQSRSSCPASCRTELMRLTSLLPLPHQSPGLSQHLEADSSNHMPHIDCGISRTGLSTRVIPD